MNARDIPLEYLDAYRTGYSFVIDKKSWEAGIRLFRHRVELGPPIGCSLLEWAYHSEGMCDALDVLAALGRYNAPTYTNVPVNPRSARHGPVIKPEGLLCKLKTAISRVYRRIIRSTRD